MGHQNTDLFGEGGRVERRKEESGGKRGGGGGGGGGKERGREG